MSASTLMANLATQGIRLEARGDRLCYRPRQAMTPELVQQVKAHKAELLTFLATADMPETTLEAFQAFDRDPTKAVDAIKNSTVKDSTAAQCGRCHSTEYRDTPIHNGQSVRRDCAECGRFIDFPQWYGLDR